MALAQRGLDLALWGRSATSLEGARAEVSAAFPSRRVLTVPCDVSDPLAVSGGAAVVLEQLGAPRVVVNNAGVVVRAEVDAMEEADWDRVLDVNLKGAFLVTRAFLPSMKRAGRGRFVQVASISATLGTPRLSAYCASKWGLVGFTKALAEELRQSGLQSLAVLPGSVDTPMLEGSGFPPQMTPQDVAALIAYVALDAPDAINGSAVDFFGR